MMESMSSVGTNEAGPQKSIYISNNGQYIRRSGDPIILT